MFNPGNNLQVGDFDSAAEAGTQRQNAMVPLTGDPHSPGFKYDVQTRFLSTRRTLPTFSLGARREVKGGSALVNNFATPANVGPDKYHPKFGTLSRLKGDPKVKFGTDLRFKSMDRGARFNETYYTYSSLGGQVNSRKLTENQFSIGKFERMSRHASHSSARILKVPLPHAAY